jgi:broad specificity phosphatase PhoE
MSKNRIEIFRHGESNYSQEVVPYNEARDLTENGIKIVRENARQLAKENIGIRTNIAVFSSPLARTLETSLIIVDELNQRGIKTESDNGIPIFIRKSIQEQINYSNSIMELLTIGGEWNGNNGKTLIDRSITNPENKTTERYILNDILNIKKEDWDKLPLDLREKILAMENSDQIQKRIIEFISSLCINSINRELTVVVTHDALIALLLRKAKSEITRIKPGERVTLDIVGNNLTVKSIAGVGIEKRIILF